MLNQYFSRTIISVVFLTHSICSFAQSVVLTEPKGSFKLDTHRLWGIDKFESLYHSSVQNTFFKTTRDTTITYANFQLGNITSANSFNPLKINLFYRDFNTVVILDNRLADIQRIDFNTTQPYRNITFISTGYDNTIWIYNQDLQILELYDYRSNSTRVKTVPIRDEILDLKSDYNSCYLLSKDYLYIYSYFGNLISKHPNTGYTTMAFSESNLILKSDDAYFYYAKKQDKILPIEGVDLLINDFLVTSETLYLYRDKTVYRYQLNLK